MPKLKFRYILTGLILPFCLFTASAQNSSSQYIKKNITGNSPNLIEPSFRNSFDVQTDSFSRPAVDSVQVFNQLTGPETKIHYARLAIVSGSSLAFFGGFYYRMKTAWWNNGETHFHFYYDGTYVKNIDKVGHMYGAILFTEGFGLGLKWAGLDEESSLLYGGLLSTLVYAGIEVKDGFAPGWGFDPVDMGADLIGSAYPYLQKKIPFLQDFTFKWSYWPSASPYYTRVDEINKNDQFFTDDYEGQTFWLSVNVRNYMPESIKSFWPDFLNLAAGMSVKHLDGSGGGDYVFLVSPDISLQKLFKPDSEFLNKLFYYLDCIHIPLPAIQVSPQFKGYAIYLNP